MKNEEKENEMMKHEDNLTHQYIENYKNICMNDIKKFTNTVLRKEVDQLNEQKNLLLNEIESISNNLDKNKDECTKEKQALRDEIESLRELLGISHDRKRKKLESCVC